MTDDWRIVVSEWLTIDEAAKHLKISKPTIFRWMRSGKVSFYKFGNSTRFRRDQLDLVAQKRTGEEEAEQLKRRCSVCGNSRFVDGGLASTGKVYFKPVRTRFLVLAESIVATQAMACTACGHIELFADPEKLSRLRPEGF